MTFGDYWLKVLAGDNAPNVSMTLAIGALMFILIYFGAAFLYAKDDLMRDAKR